MLAALGIAAAGGALPPLSAQTQPASQPASALPLYNVRNFGALADGQTLDSPAINRAIDACNAAGGGIVYLPPGVYHSGTVILKSNITLYLEAGATLLGSKNLADYSSTPGQSDGRDLSSRHLLLARDAENVTLAGPGRIDGQGSAYWVPDTTRKKIPPEESWRDVAAYIHKPLPRPSPMLEFYNCRNVRIEDLRIENAPGWTLRPINCENVFIRGIAIKNDVTGSNTDGIDITCCRNVFVSDCSIDTGDDAICLKSESPYTRNEGGIPVTKNIVITNVILTTCCNGLKFGTATRGGFENITFSNSVIFNDDVPYPARVISGIDIAAVDGGYIDGVVISNIRMQRVRTPIFVHLGHRRRNPSARSFVRGIKIDNVHATGSILTSSITGMTDAPVEDVTLSNIRIDTEEPGRAEWTAREIPELAEKYPEARMFGRLPAHGLYARHVAGLRLRNVEFHALPKEQRPAIVCDDVANLEIDALRTTPIDSPLPIIKLHQTRAATLRNCTAPESTKVFLALSGDQTRQIVLLSNDLTRAEKTADSAAEVPASALTATANATRT